MQDFQMHPTRVTREQADLLLDAWNGIRDHTADYDGLPLWDVVYNRAFDHMAVLGFLADGTPSQSKKATKWVILCRCGMLSFDYVDPTPDIISGGGSAILNRVTGMTDRDGKLVIEGRETRWSKDTTTTSLGIIGRHVSQMSLEAFR